MKITNKWLWLIWLWRRHIQWISTRFEDQHHHLGADHQDSNDHYIDDEVDDQLKVQLEFITTVNEDRY